MKSVTPTELRGNIYKILDEVLETGIPIEINKGGKKLKLIPLNETDKFKNLVSRPETINGDPEEFVHINWEKVVNLDLP